jgi:hypothetical protein
VLERRLDAAEGGGPAGWCSAISLPRTVAPGQQQLAMLAQAISSRRPAAPTTETITGRTSPIRSSIIGVS